MSILGKIEPIDAVDAIVWNLMKSDWNELQSAEADAMDMIISCHYHDAEIARHKARVAKLESAIPKWKVEVARAEYQQLCLAIADGK